jgi:hypothetical protein
MKLSHRILHVVALSMLVTTPVFAQGMAGMKHDDPDKKVEGGGKIPAGWAARTDNDASLDNVKFYKAGDGWHFTLGPAVVMYRDADKASGDYKASATFTQTKAPMHPEGYGLVIGGSDLAGAKQQYTYFLVRGDGKFLVKRRTGSETANVNAGWTDNAALNKADTSGKATNELSVSVSGGKASFMANGKEVFSTDASKIDTNGIVGLRVNHNLDVHVEGFGVAKQ